MSISILNSRPRLKVANSSDRLETNDESGETEFAARVKDRLWRRMVRECEAMAQHALGIGCLVPVEVMERFGQAISLPNEPVTDATSEGRADTPTDMALQSVAVANTPCFRLLAEAHAGFAKAIAPATPETVRLLADERERRPRRCQFGPLPLVRQMLALAMFSLAVLLAISLCVEVNNVNVSKSLLELSGLPLLAIEAFLVSAASLGACFANLQKINAVVSDGTYDPRTQSTYWTRWVMGVISGIVLSQIVYDFFVHSGDDTTPHSMTAIGQPLLALLGGYSVDFVHGILTRAVTAFGNFFGVATEGGVDMRQRAGMSEALAQPRLATASELVELRQTPPVNAEMDQIPKRLDGR